MKGKLKQALFLLCLLFSGCSPALPELHLYCWSNFIKAGLIEQFEKEHNCRVIVNTFDSNESMYAKLNLGASDYDIIFPSNYYADLLVKQDLLQPIDRSKLSNIRNIDAKYTRMLEPSITDFALPYTITYTVIGYLKGRVSMPEPTWGIFGRASLKGRMTMLNDPREALGAALKYLGYSLNTTNPVEIGEAEALLIEWKKNLAKFESEQYKNGLASAEFLAVQGFSAELLLVQKENPEVACVLPHEGSICSIDVITLSKKSQQPDLAYEFINFLLDPAVAAENTQYTQLLVVNEASYALLPESMRQNEVFFPTGIAAQKTELIKNLGKATELYNQAWDRVKAAE